MSLKNPQNLKKMLRKSPASIASGTILKRWFFLELIKSYKIFPYLKLFFVSIIKKMTFIVSVKPAQKKN